MKHILTSGSSARSVPNREMSVGSGVRFRTAELDPELIAMGMQYALYKIENGLNSFADFADDILADLGEAFRPYLKTWYNDARNFIESQDTDITDLTPHEAVRSYDISKIPANAEPYTPPAAAPATPSKPDDGWARKKDKHGRPDWTTYPHDETYKALEEKGEGKAARYAEGYAEQYADEVKEIGKWKRKKGEDFARFDARQDKALGEVRRKQEYWEGMKRYIEELRAKAAAEVPATPPKPDDGCARKKDNKS